MHHKVRLAAGVFVFCMLAACGAPAADPSATLSQVAETVGQAAVETAGTEVTREPASLPLSEPGPYYGGKRKYAFEDASRDNRPVAITVWYPALLPEGSSGPKLQVGADRDPDRSGAPYPLILSDTKAASILAPYLISHGFVWASVDRIDTWDLYGAELIEQPLDILFALEQVASNPPVGLEGMIDAEHAGATGYSFGGYNTLALSGARIDPEHYLAHCANADATAEAVISVLPTRYQCAVAGKWNEFAGHAGEAIVFSEDGLWQPITDRRIRAVMPLAGEGWMLFGREGLAAVDRPTLMVVATKDIWYPENELIFKHLGTLDKSLISFVGPGHMMIFDRDMVARMAHFMVAFFGYHLQGREELAYYFSEAFVGQYGDLAWGVYEGE